jgi:hypothetical protein
VHHELHGVAAVGGGELASGLAGERRVEQLEQRRLHVDGRDDGGRLDPLAVLEHDGPGPAAGGVDAGHRGARAHLAAPAEQPALERVGERLRPAARVPLPVEVVGRLPVDVEGPARHVRPRRAVARERRHRRAGEVGAELALQQRPVRRDEVVREPDRPPERLMPCSSGHSFAPAAASTPPALEPLSSPVTAVRTSGTALCMKAR